MRALAHWYVVVEILGALVLPLAWRLFRHLPDRGYCFSKSLAILLVGYAFWTGNAYGLLRNDLGGAVLAVLIVAVASGVAGCPTLRVTATGKRPLVEGLRRLAPLIVAAEALFFLAFGGWAVVRSWGPEASHTEQPMDLLLLSAVWTSATFPPQDPWLAGYAISYYYFGYWLLATIARLAGQPPEIAYNVGQACWFGLLLTACFGVGFNLAALARRPRAGVSCRPMVGGLLAVVAVGLIGNLQGLVDAVRVALAWFRVPEAHLAGEAGTWWWWRSSRVIGDRDLLGRPVQIIDEFPFFSYLVGDNHPHLLAMPFLLLVVALSLSLHLRRGVLDPHRGRAELAIVVIAGGAPIFLNPWDLASAWPLLVLSTAVVAPRRAVMLALILPVGTALAYWPYLLGAQSQVAGLRPNLLNPTSIEQLAGVFGLLVPGLLALLWRAWTHQRPDARLLSAACAAALGGSLAWLTGGTLLALIGLDRAGESGAPLGLILHRWSRGWPTLVLLATLLALAASFIVARRTPAGATRSPSAQPRHGEGRGFRFALILAAAGLGLVLVPELGYLLDGFGSRMNTVFKFYYQGWLLIALAASHGTVLAITEPGPVRIAGRLSAVVLALGLVFPIVSLASARPAAPSRASSLDALAHVQRLAPDEMAAIRWLRTNTRPEARVLQAIGASYEASDNRVSVATGRATLLGWEGHEVQWRGAAFAAQACGRASAVRAIYRDAPAEALPELLETWRIDYVYVGSRERATYGITPDAQARLDSVMELAFQQGDVRIYRRRG